MTTDLTIAAPIVHTEGNRVFATSRDVATYFGKRHDNVLQAIDELLRSDEEAALNFQECQYRASEGGRAYRMFEMDRDGFTLLVMGFNGDRATQFKRRYIKAFNEAIERLKEFEAKAAPVAAPTTIVEALRVALIEAEKREEAEQARAAAEKALKDAEPVITLGEQVEKHLRTVAEIGRKFEGVNSMKVKESLGAAGYLHRTAGTWRVYAKHRHTLFIERFNEYGKAEIYATPEGHRVIADLYRKGQLVMLKGFKRPASRAA